VVPAAAVQLEQLLGGHGRASEGAHHVGVVDTALDRPEISLLGRSQSDDAVAKRWIRTRERGGEELTEQRSITEGAHGNLTWASVAPMSMLGSL
jgi:hypothetical protein